MGTNFYYKKPIPEEKQKEMKDLITEDPNLQKLKDALENIEQNNIIHLGKRSAGWQFLWNLNNEKWYKANLNSIKAFLGTGGGWIENEYGEIFTIKDFLDNEIGNSMYRDEKHCDLYSYYEKHPLHYQVGSPEQHEFISQDGLRFSRHTEFC